MPRASEAPPTDKRVRLLLIGDGKIGKSHFAGLPGEQGFKVLYLDGDVAGPTITSLPAKAKENIYLMNVGDRLNGGAMQHRFADFMTDFFGSINVQWNDTDSTKLTKSTDVDNVEVWEIRPALLDHNWVLVIDSWTSLVQSVMLWAAKSHGVNLADTNTPSMRPVYQSAGNKLTQWLAIIQNIGCHVIVIAHPDEYTKLDKPEGLKVKDVKETDLRIAWTKMIPKSSSKPHSLQMAKFFTDVAWMEANKAGTERLLNFKISDERVSGGHFNDRKPMEEYSFVALVKQIGGMIPSEQSPTTPALTMHAKGEFQFPSAQGKVLNAGTKDSDKPGPDSPKPMTGRGLGALIKGN